MNRSVITLLFSIIFATTIAVVIFGSMIMGGPGHMTVGCFGSMPGATCSLFGPVEHVAAHLRAFRSVSLGVVYSSSLYALALFLFLFAVAGKFFGTKDGPGNVRSFSTHPALAEYFIEFAQWLALREKRDPSFVVAVNA